MNKTVMMIMSTLGMTVGGAIPALFGASMLGGWSILGGLIGGFVGIWLGVVVSRQLG